MAGASKFLPWEAQSAGAPRRAQNRTWAGRGSGARCTLCRGVIDEDQIEYEVELSEAHDQLLTLHLECYERWTLSRDPLEAPREAE